MEGDSHEDGTIGRSWRELESLKHGVFEPAADERCLWKIDRMVTFKTCLWNLLGDNYLATLRR